MKIPLLCDFYPFTPKLAELYGGWTEGKYFKRIFKAGTISEQVDLVNQFLNKNGFDTNLSEHVFKNSNLFEDNRFSFYKNLLGYNQIVLVYEQPICFNPLSEMMKFLDCFRDRKDSKINYTSKNLAMAISTEAGKLLDLFLWDSERVLNEDKVKNELTDIVVFCMYLADNYGIDLFDSIVEKKLCNL